MSVEEALVFIKLAGRDASLRLEVGGYKGASAIDHLVELGQRKGLRFTVEDYRRAVVASAGGELDDDALEEVLKEVGLSAEEEASRQRHVCGCGENCDCGEDQVL